MDRRRDYDRARFRNMNAQETECRRFYSRKAWKDLRAWQLRHFPLCAHCSAINRTTPAVDVDHNPPLIEQLAAGESGLDRLKVQSLCHSCHSAKTRREMVREPMLV